MEVRRGEWGRGRGGNDVWILNLDKRRYICSYSMLKSSIKTAIESKNKLSCQIRHFCAVAFLIRKDINEPRHDKTNKMSVRLAKTQISLGIRPVWSESSLCAQYVAKDSRFLHADSEDSDQTWRMPRLICLRWAHTHFVGFVMTRLIYKIRRAFAYDITVLIT